jgi:hypothetical protein
MYVCVCMYVYMWIFYKCMYVCMYHTWLQRPGKCPYLVPITQERNQVLAIFVDFNGHEPAATTVRQKRQL